MLKPRWFKLRLAVAKYLAYTVCPAIVERAINLEHYTTGAVFEAHHALAQYGRKRRFEEAGQPGTGD